MFTGLVEACGRIRTVEIHDTTRRFVVEAPSFAGLLRPGESVAVDGACLTVVESDKDAFAVDVIGTTLERTIAGRYGVGTRVNLERAMQVGSRLDGHMVQGHVDGTGHVMQIQDAGEFWLMDVRIPRDVAGTTIVHGSITLNGVSLTVSDLLDEDKVRIGIIPYTHRHTNLGSLGVGEPVNVEGDMIGKYVRRVLTARGRTEAGPEA